MKHIIWCLILFLFIGFVHSQAILDDFEIAQKLPKDTIFFVTGKSIDRLLEKVEWSKITQRYHEFYQQAAKALQKKAGLNLSPEGLREFGIDTTRPLGFAFLNIKPEYGCVFIPLANRDKAITNIYRIASENRVVLRTRKMQNLTILSSKRENNYFIFDEKYLFFISGNYSFRKNSPKIIEETIQSIRKSPLADDPHYRKAVKGLGFGSDIALYFNSSVLCKKYLEHLNRRLKRDPKDNYARRRLEQLKKNPKTTPRKIRYWTQRAESEERWQMRYQQRRVAEYEMVKSYFLPFQAVALGASFQKSSLRIKVSAAMQEGSVITKVLKNHESIPVLLKALDEKPMALANVVVDPKIVFEFAKKAIEAEGGQRDYKRFKRDLLREFQIKFEEDLIPLFSGEIGAALTGSLIISRREKEAFRNVGFSAVARITDPEKLRKILNEIRYHRGIRRHIQNDAGIDGYCIRTEWKNVYVAVVNDYLAISTNRNFCKKIRTQDGNFAEKINLPEIKDSLFVPNASIIAGAEINLFFTMALIDSAPYYYGRHYYGKHSTPYSHDRRKEVVELRKKQQEIVKKIREEIRMLRKQKYQKRLERSKSEQEALLQLGKQFGVATASAKTENSTLILQANLHFRSGSLHELVANTVDTILHLERLRREYYRKTSDLNRKTWQLERKLRRLSRQHREEIRKLRIRLKGEK